MYTIKSGAYLGVGEEGHFPLASILHLPGIYTHQNIMHLLLPSCVPYTLLGIQGLLLKNLPYVIKLKLLVKGLLCIQWDL